MSNRIAFFPGGHPSGPTAAEVGQQGFELFRAHNGGLRIVPTFIAEVGIFDLYRRYHQLDASLIASIIRFASEVGAEEVAIRAATPKKLIGLPGSERTRIERAAIRYLIERIYRSWNDSRVKLYREMSRLSDDETRISIIVQAVEAETHLISTRNPQTGQPTSAENYRLNVNNRVKAFRDEYPKMFHKVERIRKRPTQVTFQEHGDKLSIVELEDQVMSTKATLAFIAEQYRIGTLDDVAVLSLLHPHHLGAARQSFLRAQSTWTVRGLAASRGVAHGHLVWPGSSVWDAQTRSCIFICHESQPDDIDLLMRCAGAVSTRGGKSSHLAVVSRGIKIPAVVGVENLQLDVTSRRAFVNGELFVGDQAFVDGDVGEVSFGKELPPLLQRTTGEATAPESFIDWVDALAQSLVDNDRFAQLPVPLQTHIAGLRYMIRKIKAQ